MDVARKMAPDSSNRRGSLPSSGDVTRDRRRRPAAAWRPRSAPCPTPRRDRPERVDIDTGVGVLDRAVAVLDGRRARRRLPAPAHGGHRPVADAPPTGSPPPWSRTACSRGTPAGGGSDPRLSLCRARRAGICRFRDLARPALSPSRQVTGESAQLYLRDGDRRLCIDVVESDQELRTIVPVGRQPAAHARLGGAGLPRVRDPARARPAARRRRASRAQADRLDALARPAPTAGRDDAPARVDRERRGARARRRIGERPRDRRGQTAWSPWSRSPVRSSASDGTAGQALRERRASRRPARSRRPSAPGGRTPVADRPAVRCSSFGPPAYPRLRPCRARGTLSDR